MSATVVHLIDHKGRAKPYLQLGNSHRFIPVIWSHLAKKYHEALTPFPLGEMDIGGWERVWKLRSCPDLTDDEWVALLCTFDQCIIPLEHFTSVGWHLLAFSREQKYSNHIGTVAGLLLGLDAGRRPIRVQGMCFHGTTVSDSRWVVREQKEAADGGRAKRIRRPYNINRDTKHFMLNPDERPEWTAKWDVALTQAKEDWAKLTPAEVKAARERHEMIGRLHKEDDK